MPDPTPLARRLALAGVRLIIPVALTALAAGLGYALALLEIRHTVGESHHADTLADLLRDDDHRRAVAEAYHDPEAALRGFEQIAWQIPSVMTPFVGVAPWPGAQPGAQVSRHQFRGPRELRSPKLPGVTRIFLTGGSVALGSGAPDDARTVGGYLERLLQDASGPEGGRRYEVFTFAAPSWSSTHARIGIVNRLSELQPDLVISLSGVNDVFYAEFGLNVLWARSVPERFFFELVNQSLESVGHRAMVDVQDRLDRPVLPRIVAQRIAKNARVASYALGLRGVPYLFFSQPSIVTTRKALTPFERSLLESKTGFFDLAYVKRCYRVMEEQLSGIAAPNFHYRSLAGLFDDVESQVFVDSYHLGDRGYELIARAMLETVREHL